MSYTINSTSLKKIPLPKLSTNELKIKTISEAQNNFDYSTEKTEEYEITNTTIDEKQLSINEYISATKEDISIFNKLIDKVNKDRIDYFETSNGDIQCYRNSIKVDLVENNEGNKTITKLCNEYIFKNSKGDVIARFNGKDWFFSNSTGHFSQYNIKSGDWYFFNNDDHIIGCYSEYFNEKNNIYVNVSKDPTIAKRYNPKTGKYEAISIFDDENIETRQYGADQGALYYNFDEIINEQYIWNAMQKLYPVNSFEDIDEAMDFYLRYFSNINETGCGYAAAANIVFKEYEGREEDFYNTFGYPMYNVCNGGKINFNYEYFILDYFNYCYGGKYTIEEMEKGQEFSNNLQDWFNTSGVNTACELKTLDDFLKDKYGINADVSMNPIHRFDIYRENSNRFEEKCKNYTKDNDYTVLASFGYDLYEMDGTLKREDGRGHYMIITGYTNDGKVIVSSWGEKYILDASASIIGNQNDFYNINF